MLSDKWKTVLLILAILSIAVAAQADVSKDVCRSIYELSTNCQEKLKEKPVVVAEPIKTGKYSVETHFEQTEKDFVNRNKHCSREGEYGFREDWCE